MADRGKSLTVELGELKLSAADIDRIERSVQAAVLHELAAIDKAVEFRVELTRPKIKDLLDTRTRGIVIKPPAKGG